MPRLRRPGGARADPRREVPDRNDDRVSVAGREPAERPGFLPAPVQPGHPLRQLAACGRPLSGPLARMLRADEAARSVIASRAAGSGSGSSGRARPSATERARSSCTLRSAATILARIVVWWHLPSSKVNASMTCFRPPACACAAWIQPPAANAGARAAGPVMAKPSAVGYFWPAWLRRAMQ
jgi:hypothetical protein